MGGFTFFRAAFLAAVLFQLVPASAKAGPFGILGGYYIYECVNAGDHNQWRYRDMRTHNLPKDPFFCVADYGYTQCMGGVVDSAGKQVTRGYMCANEQIGQLAFREIPWYRLSCLSELVNVGYDGGEQP